MPPSRPPVVVAAAPDRRAVTSTPASTAAAPHSRAGGRADTAKPPPAGTSAPATPQNEVAKQAKADATAAAKRGARAEVDELFAAARTKKKQKVRNGGRKSVVWASKRVRFHRREPARQECGGGGRFNQHFLLLLFPQPSTPPPPAPPPPPPGSLDDVFGDGSTCANRAGRKRTEEGWPIYSEEELRLGGGGGTDKCPFDCDCCY